jgi:hypothetical protein
MNNSTGCLISMLQIGMTIIFLVIFFAALSMRQPIGQKIAELTVCQPGSIRSENSKMTCNDKKTGQKTGITIMELFGFCPSVLILVSFIIISVIVNLMIRKSRNAAMNRPNLRG